MMKSGKNSASSKQQLGRREKTQKQKSGSSPRSPLKVRVLNAASSSSSSFSSVATSVSSEAPRGCLRFFLSHHHHHHHHHSSSIASKNAPQKNKIGVSRTPKSAPNVKNRNGMMRKCENLKNQEKPFSRRVSQLRKNPLPSSRSGLFDKTSSGFAPRMGDNAVNFTPVAKMGCGSGLDGYNKALRVEERERSPTPPVQVSISPEIQGGSTSVVSATPGTCYAAGHLLSGVTDKRKCKPRGILTIGDNDLFGSSKGRMFDDGDDEDDVRPVKNGRVSLVPSLAEASINWVLSPKSEEHVKLQEDNDGSGLRSNKCEKLVPFKSISCSSSPSSSLGFSSELFNKSNSTVTNSDASATTTMNSSRSRSSFLSPDSTSEFRGLLGPSFDHLVCSPAPSSPVCAPCCKMEMEPSPEQRKILVDCAKVNTPDSEDSIGSGNVIRTPTSKSSSPKFGLSHLSRDEISRLYFECELDSVTEVLRRTSLSPECQAPVVDSLKTSFEFNPLIKHASPIDFSLFGKSEPLMQGSPESEDRISWREGLASRIFDTEELDHCRCFSDEEEDAISCDKIFERFEANSCNPDMLLQEEGNTNISVNETSLLEGTHPSVGSISDDDRSGTFVPEDSNWKASYQNHLFQTE